MTPAELAAEIAKRLFTNGAGDHAQRLVLTIDGNGATKGRDLDGWSESAAADQIERLLVAHWPELSVTRLTYRRERRTETVATARRKR